MDPDRCFLRLAVDRGLVPAALAEECAARAAPGGAARLLVERARLRPDIAQALLVEAQRVARSRSGGHMALPPPGASGMGRIPPTVPDAGPTQHATRGPNGETRPTVVGRPGGPGWQAGSQFGRYELIEELGRGGMGVVWRARQLDLDRDVALKMLAPGRLSDDRVRQRFLAEARAVARLSHPHIVGVYDVGEQDGTLFFTMEYVDGGSLSKLPPGDTLTPIRATRIGLALAGALECAHAEGIVHRDLKPANVLLAGDGTPRLTDFGIAKDLQSGSITQSGEILGTPAYMSPEQADGRQGKVDGRSDVYALGAVLYRLLTGRPPFEAGTPYETLRKVLASAVTAPRRLAPSVPPALEAVVLRCLEKNPAQRYPDAGALRAALAEVEESLGDPDEHEPVAGRERGAGPPAWFWPALLGGLLLLVGGGLSVAWWREHARAEEEKAAHARLLAQQEEQAQKARDEAERGARSALELATRDPRAALARLEELGSQAPEVAAVQAALGILRLEVSGDAQGALTALDAALRLDETNVTARVARGRCLVRLGREPAEVQVEIERLEPAGLAGKAGAAELRGELALREGKGTLAVGQLREAVRRLPDDARLRRRLARALVGIHRLDQAQEELEHAGRLEPDSPELGGLRAALLVQQQRPGEARQAAEQALQRDPQQADAREVLAALEEERPRRAIPPSLPLAAHAEHPPDQGGHEDEAHKRTHQALKELRQALQKKAPAQEVKDLWAQANAEQDPPCAPSLLQRIELGRALRRWGEVRRDLAHLIRLVGEQGKDARPLLVQLIELDSEQSHFQEAEQEIEQLRQATAAEDPTPWVLLAELRQKQNRAEDALAAWDKVVELAPQDGELLHERGHVLAALGRLEDALRDMQRAVELGGRRPGHYQVFRGDLLVELGRNEEARAAFQAGLEAELSKPEEKHAREALARLSAPSESGHE